MNLSLITLQVYVQMVMVYMWYSIVLYKHSGLCSTEMSELSFTFLARRRRNIFFGFSTIKGELLKGHCCAVCLRDQVVLDIPRLAPIFNHQQYAVISHYVAIGL